MKKLSFLIMILTLLFIFTGCKRGQNEALEGLLEIESKSTHLDLSPNPFDKWEFSKKFVSKKIDNFDQTTPKNLFASENGVNFAAVKNMHEAASGDVSFEKVYGYSFYIVNSTTSKEDYKAKLKLEIKKDDGLSSAIRIMTYYEIDEEQFFKVYQKEDSEPFKYDLYSFVESKNALIKFIDSSSIFENEEIIISGVLGQNNLRYTILFWLEGDDPDCNQSMLSKMASFKLTIE